MQIKQKILSVIWSLLSMSMRDRPVEVRKRMKRKIDDDARIVAGSLVTFPERWTWDNLILRDSGYLGGEVTGTFKRGDVAIVVEVRTFLDIRDAILFAYVITNEGQVGWIEARRLDLAC